MPHDAEHIAVYLFTYLPKNVHVKYEFGVFTQTLLR